MLRAWETEALFMGGRTHARSAPSLYYLFHLRSCACSASSGTQSASGAGSGGWQQLSFCSGGWQQLSFDGVPGFLPGFSQEVKIFLPSIRFWLSIIYGFLGRSNTHYFDILWTLSTSRHPSLSWPSLHWWLQYSKSLPLIILTRREQRYYHIRSHHRRPRSLGAS